MMLYLSNRCYNELIIRCFTNGIEAILSIVALHYYLRIGNKFDRNIAIFTVQITLSFVMRNTSPIGWLPLVIIKIIKDKSLLAFIKSAILVSIPILAINTFIDTLYYGGD